MDKYDKVLIVSLVALVLAGAVRIVAVIMGGHG